VIVGVIAALRAAAFGQKRHADLLRQPGFRQHLGLEGGIPVKLHGDTLLHRWE
jgi:hypothetical protein